MNNREIAPLTPHENLAIGASELAISALALAAAYTFRNSEPIPIAAFPLGIGTVMALYGTRRTLSAIRNIRRDRQQTPS